MKKGLKIALISLGVVIILASIYFIFNTSLLKPKKEVLENVTMTIQDGTLTKTGATIIITDLNKEKCMFGRPYHIENYTAGKWKALKPKKAMNFTMEGLFVGNDNELKLDLDWEDSYGELKPGRYRIVKTGTLIENGVLKKDKYLYAEFTINDPEVKLGLITNALTNTISVNNDEAQVILNLFDKYEYTTETCDGEAVYELIIDKDTYGIEVYGYGVPNSDTEIHITTIGKEIVLDEEDSLKLLKIINDYVPDNYKPIVDCLKDRLGAFIADQSLEFKEKDITSLIKIDKTKLDYSYLKTNEHGGFYLIVKTDDNNILEEITEQLETKYEKVKSTSYESYKLYVYNGSDDALQNLDFSVCQFK